MIFKRQLSVFFAFVLLTSNSGLAFNVHYCGSKITGVSALRVPDMKSCCGTTKGNCCANKILSVKKVSENTLSKSVVLSVPAFYGCSQSLPFSIAAAKVQRGFPQCATNDGSHAPPLYLLYSQYLFYA